MSVLTRFYCEVAVEVADLDAIIDVHLKGAFFVTQPAFRVMKDRGYGRILFTSSSSGIWGNFGQTNYGASKMGMIGMMNTLAQEGAKYNVKINALAPTAGTRMTEGLIDEKAFALLTPNSNAIAAAAYLTSTQACKGF